VSAFRTAKASDIGVPALLLANANEVIE